jgi:rhodanese-related sulfurtransferase
MQTLIASLVLETPAAPPETSNRHFVHKLTVETDPSDVKTDLDNGATGFVVIDARSADGYKKAHVPGAKSLPHWTINAETTAGLSKETLLVVYCWSPACNGATKACAKLSGLGFRVKEMIGGIEYWRKEGYPVEGTEAG